MTDSFILSLHVLSTWFMVGVIWFVQCVQYPLFSEVGVHEFRKFHQKLMSRISFVVMPPMILEISTWIGLWMMGLRTEGFLLSGMILGVIWCATFFVQVPCHRVLSRGFDAPTHLRLLRTNWIRTLFWTLRGLIVLQWIRYS